MLLWAPNKQYSCLKGEADSSVESSTARMSMVGILLFCVAKPLFKSKRVFNKYKQFLLKLIVCVCIKLLKV